MPMNDDSAQDHPLPLFLSNDTEDVELRGSSRILWTGFLFVMALAVGGATLLLGGPGSHITALTASVDGASTPAVTDNGQATPPPQSAVEAQQPSPAETEAASNQQPAVASPELAGQKQADATANSETLFRQFQAWAQQQDGKPDQQPDSAQESRAPATSEVSAPAEPAAETTQAVPTRAEPKAPASAGQAPLRAAQKRSVRELRNARAEIESARRAKTKSQQTYGTQPPEETRAPETPAQTTETPWLLRLFGGQTQN